MRYVLPVPRELRGMLLPYPRLYAYPTEPEAPSSDNFVILDSGAFGLAMSGKRMDESYIQALARHYERYHAPTVLCIAPDEYPNPWQTMKNFQEWRGVPVVPVIQFARKRHVDAYLVWKQAIFYAQHLSRLPCYGGRPVVAVSNPALHACEVSARVWQSLCATLRKFIPDAWLHLLGAGWDIQDIAAWAAMRCFDSIDSIAYYTAAQAGQAWNPVEWRTWQELAIRNAERAQEIASLS